MKYMGSKQRIAKQIIPIIQGYICRSGVKAYYEPFCGGCNVIDKIHCENRYANDISPYLIALFKRVQEGEELLESVSREYYNEVRYNYAGMPEEQNWLIGNVGYLASYGGRFFDGGFAPPRIENGVCVRDYYKEAKSNLLKQSLALQDIEFLCGDYKDLQPHNAVVYCDPPYVETKGYQLQGTFDTQEFWECVRRWSEDNIVLVSECTAPADFSAVLEVATYRSLCVSNKNTVTEKLYIHESLLGVNNPMKTLIF